MVPKQQKLRFYDSSEGILSSLRSSKAFLSMIQDRRDAALRKEALSWFLVRGMFELREDGWCVQWRPGLSGVEADIVEKSAFRAQNSERCKGLLSRQFDKYVIVPPSILRCSVCGHIFRAGDREDVMKEKRRISLKRFTGVPLGKMLARIVNSTGGVYGIPIQSNILNGMEEFSVNLFSKMDLGRFILSDDYLEITFLSYRHKHCISELVPLVSGQNSSDTLANEACLAAEKGLSMSDVASKEKKAARKEVRSRRKRNLSKSTARSGGTSKERKYRAMEERRDWYKEALGRFQLLGADEEKELAAKVSEGDMASRDRFVCANLRLAFWVAVRFWSSHKGHAVMALDDCVQEANLALLGAVEEFDTSFGVRFSTYAAPYIRGKLRVAHAETFHQVSFPRLMHWQFTKFHREMELFLEIFDREEAMTRAAAEAKISLKVARKYADMYLFGVMSIDEERENAKGDGKSLLDTLVSQMLSPEDVVSLEDQRTVVQGLLDTLDPRKRSLLLERHGFFSDTPRTLRSLGEDLGVSFQRARQIQISAHNSLHTVLERRGCRKEDFLGD